MFSVSVSWSFLFCCTVRKLDCSFNDLFVVQAVIGGDGDCDDEDAEDGELGEAMASGCRLHDDDKAGCSQDNNEGTDSSHDDAVDDATAESVNSASQSSFSRLDIAVSDTDNIELTSPRKKQPSDNPPSDSDDDDDAPSLLPIGDLNKLSQPFRDDAATDDLESDATVDNDQRFGVEEKRPGMDPRLVKRKIKSQMHRKQACLLARRTRKHGEAALSTKLRRENSDDIKQSLGPVWGD